MRGSPNTSDSPPATAPVTKIARQPYCPISAPASTGPARPMPKVVPSRLNARVRAAPSNSCASARPVPPASAAAAAGLRGAQQVDREHRRRERKRARHQREAADADREQALAAELVGQRAGRHQETAEREHERVGDPVHRDRPAVQVAADRGRRDGAARNDSGSATAVGRRRPAPMRAGVPTGPAAEKG